VAVGWLHEYDIDLSPYVVEASALTKRFGDRTVVHGVELRAPFGPR
jgi:hypothetical protein